MASKRPSSNDSLSHMFSSKRVALSSQDNAAGTSESVEHAASQWPASWSTEAASGTLIDSPIGDQWRTQDAQSGPFVGQASTSTSMRARKRISLVRPRSGRLSLDYGDDSRKSIPGTSREELDESTFRASLTSLNEIMSKAFDRKNAFQYDFINNLNAILRRMKSQMSESQVGEREPLNFRLLAKSFEAGTKLYVSKVENAYQDTKKLSNYFDRLIEVEEFSFSGSEGRASGSSRRKDKRPTTRIVTDLETINQQLDTELQVDPIFHKLLSGFNENKSSDCLLLVNLQVNSRGVMSLDASDTLDCTNEPQFEPSSTGVFHLPLAYIEERHNVLGQALSTLQFTQRNVILTDILLDGTQVDKQQVSRLNSYAFDLSSPSNEMPFEDRQFNLEKVLSHKDNSEQLLRILPDQETNSHSFFDRNFLKTLYRNFTRFSYLFKDRDRMNGSVRTRRPPNEYGAQLDEDMFDSVNQSHSMLSYKTVKNWEPIPRDFDYGFQPIMLRKLFAEVKHLFEMNPQMAGHQTEAANDSCNDAQINGHWLDTEQEAMEGAQKNTDHFEAGQENSEVDYVSSLDITYVKSALKLNFRSLKSDMWKSILSGSKCSQTKLSQPVGGMSAGSDSVELTFDQVLQGLSPAMKENRAVAFVALLHLCNERRLQLSGGGTEPIVIRTNASPHNEHTSASTPN